MFRLISRQIWSMAVGVVASVTVMIAWGGSPSSRAAEPAGPPTVVPLWPQGTPARKGPTPTKTFRR